MWEMLLAASFALETVGALNEYNYKRNLLDLQEENLDLQRQSIDLEEKIAIRNRRAQQRREQSEILVRNTAANVQRSSTTTSMMQASQSSALNDIQNISYGANIQQQQLDIAEAQERLNTPSPLDLVLNIGGNIAGGLLSYKSTKDLLDELRRPATQAPGNTTSNNTTNSTRNFETPLDYITGGTNNSPSALDILLNRGSR